MGPRTRGRPEPAMTIARSVADVLRDHVVLEYEAIDRMYIQLPPGKGEPASRKRVLHGQWQHPP